MTILIDVFVWVIVYVSSMKCRITAVIKANVDIQNIKTLEKWFPLQGERGHSLSFGVFKRKGDRTTDLSI